MIKNVTGSNIPITLEVIVSETKKENKIAFFQEFSWKYFMKKKVTIMQDDIKNMSLLL